MAAYHYSSPLLTRTSLSSTRKPPPFRSHATTCCISPTAPSTPVASSHNPSTTFLTRLRSLPVACLASKLPSEAKHITWTQPMLAGDEAARASVEQLQLCLDSGTKAQLSGFVIREATADDAEKLQHIDAVCYRTGSAGWSLQLHQEDLERPGACIVVLEERTATGSSPGEVIGFISGYDVAGELQLLNLAVMPASRGQGRGAALLAAWLRKCRCDEYICLLDVHAANTAALSLYKSFGFKTVGVRRKYYADGGDALLMTRDPAPLF